ncbi:MAG: 5-formyltetrahydrofolate cyclo-ligase [Gammaproteobacteria bacterium]|nr:5-formyltetrahydrofolate cyclo-ligase [Gammaproteobacteria bacterium]
MAVDPNDRKALRRQLRNARRALSGREQYEAAHALLAQLRVRPEVRRARRVAVYLPQDGEIDPGPLADWLSSRGCLVCLPVIDPIARGSQRLRFAPCLPDLSWRSNRFGIDEPVSARPLEPWTLDLVFLPLVGFDAAGNRLGMGGGFYDRTFDHRRPRAHRPRLIGLAHSLQQVDALACAEHDVPLDAIATDQAFLVVVPRPSKILGGAS